MKIGLIDVDSKIPNLALMKISNYYKSLGCSVEFVQAGANYDKIYASAIFTRSYNDCLKLQDYYGGKIEIGGTGWNIKKELPEEIDRMKPDYDLYKIEDIASRIKGIMTKVRKMEKAEEMVNAGMGFTSRGYINQGCDVRLMTDEIAQALREVKHLRSIHYAWDLMGFEGQVLEGIKTLSKHIKTYNHMCFMLVGFNTTFEEDMYRFKKLNELGIRPYVMRYNEKKDDERLNKFARWVDSMIYKAVPNFEEYEPWKRIKDSYESQVSMF